MSVIKLANSGGRDAEVASAPVGTSRVVRWLDSSGRQVTSERILKAPIEREIDALKEKLGGLAEISQAIIDGDPEIDLEKTGSFLRETSRVYVNPRREVVHKVQFFELIRNPDGTMRERRPRKLAEPNLATETALRWSKTFIRKDEAIRKFVFSGKQQLGHINGLTYDFLYGMAKELEERNSLMILGAGPKSNQPLILRRGGSPYRGFLEGRTQGDLYALILHFSNLELKKPDTASDEEGGEA